MNTSWKPKLWGMKDDTKEGKKFNRVLQHEIDHLNGIINIDKVDSKELILESDPDYIKNAKYEEIKA